MNRNSIKLISLIWIMSMAGYAIGSDAETAGLKIAMEADIRDTGFQDYTADVKMTLKNKQGDVSIRNMRYKVLEQQQDGDKSIVIFDTPKDIKGVAALTYSHKTTPDDQWLYIPELKRTKRIATVNKSGPFMGSEFAYEDISSEEVEKYNYKYIKDGTHNGEACFIVERYPVDPYSGYSKQIVWYDKSEYRIQKIEYYDRKNSLLKVRNNHDYRKYAGKYWRPDKSSMENLQTGKSTDIEWRSYKFRQGLNDNQFSVSGLKRLR